MVSVHPARSEMVFPEGVLSFWQSLLVFQVPISLLTRAVLQSLSRGTSVAAAPGSRRCAQSLGSWKTCRCYWESANGTLKAEQTD